MLLLSIILAPTEEHHKNMEVESNHVEGTTRNKLTILGNAVRGIKGALKYVIQNGNKVFAPIIKLAN